MKKIALILFVMFYIQGCYYVPTNNELAQSAQNVKDKADDAENAKTDEEKAAAEKAYRDAQKKDAELKKNRQRVDMISGYAEQPLNNVGGGVLGTLICGGLGYLGVRSRKKRKENEEELSIKKRAEESLVVGINNFTGLDLTGIFDAKEPKELVIAQVKQKLLEELMNAQEMFGTRDTIRQTRKNLKNEDQKL